MLRTIILISLISLGSFTSSGQVTSPPDNFHEYPGLKSISVNGTMKVIFIQGSTEGISFENEADMPTVEVLFKKGKMTIMKTKGASRDSNPVINVYFKNLAKIYARGTCMLLNTVKIEQKMLSLYASGGSSVDFDLTLTSLRADLNGQATVTLKGRGIKETINSDGLAKFNGYNFMCESAFVKAESDSEVYVYVDKMLKTNGSPNIRYMGNPASVDGGSSNRY